MINKIQKEILKQKVISLLQVYTLLSTNEFYDLGVNYFDYFKKGNMYCFLKILEKERVINYIRYSRSTGAWKLNAWYMKGGN